MNFKRNNITKGPADIEKSSDNFINIEQGNNRFYGQYTKSPNKRFMVAFCDRHKIRIGKIDDWVSGQVCLIENMERVIWNKDIERPNGAYVNNEGRVMAIDWMEKKENILEGKIHLFNLNGDKLNEYKFNSNIADGALSPNGEKIVITTCNPDNSIYFFDMKTGGLIEKHKNPERKVLLRFTFNEIEKILENAEKIKKLTPDKRKDYILDSIITGLKSTNSKTLISSLGKVRYSLVNKKEYENEIPKLIPLLISCLKNSNKEVCDLSQDILLNISRKNRDLIEDAIPVIINRLKKDQHKHPYLFKDLNAITELARIDFELIEEFIPFIVNTLKKSKYWNQRREAAFTLAQVCSNKPEILKNIIPILINYIKYPEKVEKEVKKLAKIDQDVAIDLMVAGGLGADPKTWLQDACIDSIGIIGKKNPELVKDVVPILKELAKSAESQYTRKKAQRALEGIKIKI